MLLDYLTPMLQDPYILEAHFLELFLDHLQPQHQRPLLKILKLTFTELSSYIPRLFTTIVYKMAPLKIDSALGQANPELNFLLVLTKCLFNQDECLQALFKSKSFNEDLEMLF
jgi:hypothetical protein